MIVSPPAGFYGVDFRPCYRKLRRRRPCVYQGCRQRARRSTIWNLNARPGMVTHGARLTTLAWLPMCEGHIPRPTDLFHVEQDDDE